MLSELKLEHQFDSQASIQNNQNQEMLNQGVWRQHQLLKFMVFSSYNVTILASKLQRRTNKVFKQMARFIGTRTSTQCRSQNQKLVKKYKNIKKILKAYELRFGKKEFEIACKQHFCELKAMQLRRKKLRNSVCQNFASICTQTEFPIDSEDSENSKIKVQEQNLGMIHFLNAPYKCYGGFQWLGNGGIRNPDQ